MIFETCQYVIACFCDIPIFCYCNVMFRLSYFENHIERWAAADLNLLEV